MNIDIHAVLYNIDLDDDFVLLFYGHNMNYETLTSFHLFYALSEEGTSKLQQIFLLSIELCRTTSMWIPKGHILSP